MRGVLTSTQTPRGVQRGESVEDRGERSAGKLAVCVVVGGLDVEVHRRERGRGERGRLGSEVAVGLPQHVDAARSPGLGQRQRQLHRQGRLGVGERHRPAERGGLVDDGGDVHRLGVPGDAGLAAVLGDPVVDAIVAPEGTTGRRESQRRRPGPEVVEGFALDLADVTHRAAECRGLHATTDGAPHGAGARLPFA